MRKLRSHIASSRAVSITETMITALRTIDTVMRASWQLSRQVIDFDRQTGAVMKSRRNVAVVAAILVMLVGAASFAQSTTAPSTQPADEVLIGGAILFAPPAGWTPAGERPDKRLFVYEAPDHSGTMVVNVDPQEVSLENNSSAAMKIGQMVSKQIRDNAAKPGSEVQITDQPRIEKDNRFFLCVHHRFTKPGKIGDQLQIYRAIGNYLVAVAVTAWADSPEKAKPVHELAEQVLLSAHLRGTAAGGGATRNAAKALPRPSSKPVAPISLPHAKLRVAVPAELGNWEHETSDAESGIVLTFRDPQARGLELIALSVKPLPKEAKSDPKLRDAIVDQMLESDRQQLKIEGAQSEAKTDVIKDNRFLRKTRSKYQTKADEIQLISRDLRIGDALVAVSAVGATDQIATIDKLADELAVGIRAMGR
jgi:hypothetical protein